MAKCFLQIGIDEYLDGDVLPSVLPMETIIPDTHEPLFRFLDYDLYLLEEPEVRGAEALKKVRRCLMEGGIAAMREVYMRQNRLTEEDLRITPEQIEAYEYAKKSMMEDLLPHFSPNRERYIQWERD